MAADHTAASDDAREGLESDDTLLLLLSAVAQQDPAGVVPGVTRLMKLLFLAGQEAGIEGSENFSFVPYKYGPFAEDLYPTLAHLRQLGLVDVRETPARDFYQDLELRDLGDPKLLEAAHALGYRGRESPTRQIEVGLTPVGQELAMRLRQRLSPSKWTRLQRVVSEYAGLPLNELLAYVYQRYPSMAKSSVLPLARGRGADDGPRAVPGP
jgi:hypothetical protein